MIALKYAFVIIVGYLLGSLNFSIIISKWMMKKDIRNYGSGNAGSTNAFRMMGAKKTLLVVLGDMLKGIAGVLVAYAVFPLEGMFGSFPVYLTGFAVIVGHVFPIYFRFQGGKGILTTAAILILFDWRSLLIIFAIFLIAAIATKYVSLGSVLAAAAFPFTIVAFYPGELKFILLAFVWGIGVIVLHRGNIKRLLAGTEKKFSFKQKSGGTAE